MYGLNKDERYRVQLYARHKMILKLLKDIQQDLLVCSLEGWPKMEYIGMLREELNKLPR